MIEAGAYRESGGFNPAVRWSQDYDLWLRLAARHPGAVIGTPLITYWSSPGQLSRKVEERHKDDLAILERVARGELRRDPVIQSRAATKAAGLAFDLALLAVRGARPAEARELFARAASAGPWRRRLLASAGALPAGAIAARRVPARCGVVGGARRSLRQVDRDAAQEQRRVPVRCAVAIPAHNGLPERAGRGAVGARSAARAVRDRGG